MKTLNQILESKNERAQILKTVEQNILMKSLYMRKKNLVRIFLELFFKCSIKNNTHTIHYLSNKYNIPEHRVHRIILDENTVDEKKLLPILNLISQYREKYNLNDYYSMIKNKSLSNKEITFLNEIRKDLKLKFFHNYNNGYLINIEPYGYFDTKLLKKYSVRDIVDFNNHILEIQSVIFEQYSKKENRIVTNITIIDLNGVSVIKLMSPQFVEIIKLVVGIHTQFEKKVSEFLILTNVPKSFYTFWKVISVFVPAETLKKVKLVNDNGLDILKQYIDTDILPIENGGKCLCSECCDSDFYKMIE